MLVFTLVTAQFDSPCLTSKCKNSAICTPIDAYNYTCTCTNTSYWNGTYCDTPGPLNPCLSSPCLSGSTCVFDLNLNIFACICPTGYFGYLCGNATDQVII